MFSGQDLPSSSGLLPKCLATTQLFTLFNINYLTDIKGKTYFIEKFLFHVKLSIDDSTFNFWIIHSVYQSKKTHFCYAAINVTP
jgi:hypothetical protein